MYRFDVADDHRLKKKTAGDIDREKWTSLGLKCGDHVDAATFPRVLELAYPGFH